MCIRDRRVPFLDKEIMALAQRIPLKYRVNSENTKYAMRKAALRRMPEKWAGKKKLGFPVPTRVWLREDKYYSIVKEKFTGADAEKFFHTEPVSYTHLDVYKRQPLLIAS